MNQTSSELDCSGILGSAGCRVGWLAHEVFCPQKWSLDGKFENHWSGSLRVSLDAFPILGLSLQTLPFLVGSRGAGGGAVPGLGPGPGSSGLGHTATVFQETLSSQGLGPDLLGGVGGRG